MKVLLELGGRLQATLLLLCLLLSLGRPGEADDSWLATTPEGTWIQAGSSTLYLQNFSPYPLFINLALLATPKLLSQAVGGEWLSEYLPHRSADWLHWAGQAAGLLGAGWYFSSAVEDLAVFSGKGQPINVQVEVPEVSSRLVLQLVQGRGTPVLIILRNPVSSPAALTSDMSPVVRAMLSIHREMVSRSLDRLELALFQDIKGAGFRFGWRTQDQDWLWIHPGARFAPLRQSVWIEHGRYYSDTTFISLLQAEVLEYLLNILKRGRSAGLDEDIHVPALEVDWAGEERWSAILSAGKSPVVLEGNRRQEHLQSLRLIQLGGAETAADVYRIPRSWTALAQALMNVMFLPVDLRPQTATSAEGSMESAPLTARLDLLKAGKVAGVGVGAETVRKIQGEPREFKVAHLGGLKDSNRIVLSEKVYNEFLHELETPWNFELTGNDGCKGWAAPAAGFSPADDNLLYMSEHMMNRLQVRPGDDVTLQPVKLGRLRDVEFKVLQGPVRTEDQMVSMLEQAIDRRYPILHRGEIVRLTDPLGDKFSFQVDALNPAGATYTPGTEADVSIKRPDQWPASLSLGAEVAEAGKVSVPFVSGAGRILESGHIAPPLTVEERTKWQEMYAAAEPSAPQVNESGKAELDADVVNKVVLEEKLVETLVRQRAILDKNPDLSETVKLKNVVLDELVMNRNELSQALDKMAKQRAALKEESFRFQIKEKLGRALRD